MQHKPRIFDALVGNKFNFYGIDNNCFKLDDTVYEAVKDPCDGYRSMLSCVQVNEKDKIFFKMWIARVALREVRYKDYDEEIFKGYKLIDTQDKHCWLRFGTANYGNWYPYFVFEYTPKAP